MSNFLPSFFTYRLSGRISTACNGGGLHCRRLWRLSGIFWLVFLVMAQILCGPQQQAAESYVEIMKMC